VKNSSLLGWKNPKYFPKSPDFLGALSGGFTFHGSLPKRALQIWSTNISLFEKNIG